jgi:hypothetical protein
LRLFYIALGMFLLTFAKVSTLNCERTPLDDGFCKIVKQGFLWSEEKSIPVDNLKGARIIDNDRNTNSQNYQIVLVTNKGNIPFSPNTSFSEKKQRYAVSRIDSFARSKDKGSLDVSLDDRWWVIVGIISLTIGVYPYLSKNFTQV